jgi:hypothetical protein
MTLNFSTATSIAQIELSDYNGQRVIFAPTFTATDYATLQADAELTANKLADITGLHFESLTLKKKYTHLHSPILLPAATIERVGMVVCELVAPPEDYFMLEIPDPVATLMNPDETINLTAANLLNYANVFRLNAYGTNGRLLAATGGNTSMLASLRVPVLKAIKSEKAIG